MTGMKVFDLIELSEPIQILDVGAAAIAETPVYRRLMDRDMGFLNAFEGDPRQIDKIHNAYPEKARIFPHFLFDGTPQNVHLCSANSGMTSLYKPKEAALKFFNGFEQYGEVHAVKPIETMRLDDVPDVPGIDFLKMDIQGAELTVMQNGTERLAGCLAAQLEVSYIQLYEDQPSFGDVDVWMRAQGFEPHCFLDVKKWSIAPTVFGGDVRNPGNQLIESDIVYIRNPMALDGLSNLQLIKLALLAHYCFQSVDLCILMLRALSARGAIEACAPDHYMKNLGTFT